MKRILPFLLVAFTALLLAFCGTQPSGQSSTASSSDNQIAAKKDLLVLFPFTGGNSTDGESIVSSLNRQQVLRDAFNDTMVVTQSRIAALGFEHRFQQNFGIIDADTIFELGKELKASHVIAGHITKLNNQNLIIVSIMDVESLQQIAGDYRTYDTIEEISRLIPDIAKKLAAAVALDTSGLEGLSVPPFYISRDVNQNDAMVLAQILACDLANLGSYAVLPRTDSFEKVMEELERQRSGDTSSERNKRLGKGRDAVYVLDGHVERWGQSLTKFTADILYLDGRTKKTAEEEYTDRSQGFYLMPKLAAQLSGISFYELPTDFVRVEGGTFQMGSNNSDNDEKPIHTVTVKSFSMSKYPVTQKEWFDVMGTTIRQQRDMADKSWPLRGEGDNYPMYYVNWNEAVEYCNKRSLKEGLTPVYRGSGNSITCDWNANGYRLPTEAEWEYAAKGGNKDYMIFEYSGSNSVDAVGWYSANSGSNTHPVGTKAPNSLGLYDMSGNVWEWCWDWYVASYYASSPSSDPKGASSGSDRVIRGGSWNDGARGLRSANRDDSPPSRRGGDIGFRLVRN
jgi:formylglycine-generating enzyme